MAMFMLLASWTKELIVLFFGFLLVFLLFLLFIIGAFLFDCDGRLFLLLEESYILPIYFYRYILQLYITKIKVDPYISGSIDHIQFNLNQTKPPKVRRKHIHVVMYSPHSHILTSICMLLSCTHAHTLPLLRCCLS